MEEQRRWEKDHEYPHINASYEHPPKIKCTRCEKEDSLTNWVFFIDAHKNCSPKGAI